MDKDNWGTKRWNNFFQSSISNKEQIIAQSLLPEAPSHNTIFYCLSLGKCLIFQLSFPLLSLHTLGTSSVEIYCIYLLVHCITQHLSNLIDHGALSCILPIKLPLPRPRIKPAAQVLALWSGIKPETLPCGDQQSNHWANMQAYPLIIEVTMLFKGTMVYFLH